MARRTAGSRSRARRSGSGRFPRPVALADSERVQRGRYAEDHADRAPGDLRRHRGTRGTRGMDPGHDPPPALRVGRPVGQQEPDRTSDLFAEPREPGELGRFVLEIAVHAEGAGSGRTQAPADAAKLVDLGEAAGHHLARHRLVRVGPRGGKAEGAGMHRLLGQPAHLGDVVGARRLAADRAVAHHIDAQRVVWNLCRYIDRARHPLEGVEEIGKALPIPFEALGEDRARNVLDPLHQIDQRVAMLGPHRCEPDPAIAEEDGGDPMPGGGRQDRVPGRLPVIMGVHVDPARVSPAGRPRRSPAGPIRPCRRPPRSYRYRQRYRR